MSQYVPASTSIKRRSIKNVPVARLLRRRRHLIDTCLRPGRFQGSRHDFTMRAHELAMIEDRLDSLRPLQHRVTLPPHRRGHVVVSVPRDS